jgi:hypothetical protein
LNEIGFIQQDPVVIFEDNKSTIHLVNGRSNHKANKHINPKFKYVQQQIQLKSIHVCYLATEDMVADVLTKPLGGSQHRKLSSRLMNCQMRK